MSTPTTISVTPFSMTAQAAAGQDPVMADHLSGRFGSDANAGF